VKSKLRGIDERIIRLQRIRDEFWKPQCQDLWTNGLKVYLAECQEFIESGTIIARQACKARIEDLMSTDHAGRKSRLEGYLGEFEKLEADRAQIAQALRQELDAL